MRRRSLSPSHHLKSIRTTNVLTVGRSSDVYKDLFKSWLDSSESSCESLSLQAISQRLIEYSRAHEFKVDPTEMNCRVIGQLLALSLTVQASRVSKCGSLWSISAHAPPSVGPLHVIVSRKRLSSLESRSDQLKVCPSFLLFLSNI